MIDSAQGERLRPAYLTSFNPLLLVGEAAFVVVLSAGLAALCSEVRRRALGRRPPLSTLAAEAPRSLADAFRPAVTVVQAAIAAHRHEWLECSVLSRGR